MVGDGANWPGNIACQLDTGAQAGVMTTKQLQSIAPDAWIRQTHKRLVSYRQHHIMPRGCATLTVKHNQKETRVKYFIISQAQNPILSGKACKVLEEITTKIPGDKIFSVSDAKKWISSNEY